MCEIGACSYCQNNCSTMGQSCHSKDNAMLIKLTSEQKQHLITELHEGSTPSFPFYILVTLSTVIAAYGLLANSTAVVIGAMLIAPLMGPIFGITIALIRGERTMLLRALLAEFLGVLMAIAIAYLIGKMPLRPDFGSEILARTQPTLFDLLIAFFSGLAGAYAMVNPKVSPAIAGVAIATALVPPLATCGLCLASGNLRLGLGAFLLFLINFFAIQFAAAIIFMLAHLEERDRASQQHRLIAFMAKFGPGLAVLVLLGVFLTNVLVEIITQRKTETQMSRQLSEMLSESQGAQLVTGKLNRKTAPWEFTAEVITPQAFSPALVGTFEDNLAKVVMRPVHLILRSLITKDVDRNGPVFVSQEELTGLDVKKTESELLQQTSSLISRETQKIPGALLTDLRRDEAIQGFAFTATIQAPSTISPETVALIQKLLQIRLARPVKLIVRTILTRDADSERFIYADEATTRQPTAVELALQSALEGSIQTHLTGLPPGASLLELSSKQGAERLIVNAKVQAPRAITPAEVQALQHYLRLEVRMDLDLTVHTTVQATATAESYISESQGSQNEISP